MPYNEKMYENMPLPMHNESNEDYVVRLKEAGFTEEDFHKWFDFIFPPEKAPKRTATKD